MRKLFLGAALLAAAGAAFGQGSMSGTTGAYAPDCTQSFTVTATGRQIVFDNRKSGCLYWTLYWSNNSSVATFSVEVDSAADANASAGSFAAMAASPGSTNPSTTGASGMISTYGAGPWVSANVTTLTGAGGSMAVLLIGYRPLPGAEKGPRWKVTSNPAAGSQATASFAAASGVRHTADCVSFSAGSTTAPALTALTVNLRDGATGAGTVLQTWQVVIPAATGQNVSPFSVCGLGLIGTANTAMTLEFSASLANLIESVSITGFDQ